MPRVKIKFPPIAELVIPRFEPIFYNQDRYLLLNGSRDSGKSVTAQRIIIFRMLTHKYFRGLLLRKTFNTIKDSMWQGIKDDVIQFGLSQFFTFRQSPLEIECFNGNKIVARGLDEPEKIKSFKNPTFAWWEEANENNLNDFTTVTTTLRSSEADFIQELFTFNNEVEGVDFTDFWLFKQFFAKRYPEKSFSDFTEIEIENQVHQLKYTVLHSTYKDNAYCDPQRIAIYEQLKLSDPYKYQIYALGEWANKEVGGRYLKNFAFDRHVGKCQINKDINVYISFDENVNPYPAMTVWQVEQVGGNSYVKQLYEICLFSPNNKLKSVVRDLCSWMRRNEYNAKIYITGDATSDKEDTKLERGANYFTMVQSALTEEGFKSEIRKQSTNPSQALRSDFINDILAVNYGNIYVMIDDGCKLSIQDYLNTQERDGGVWKKKNKEGYEPYGHIVNTFEYLMINVFSKEFSQYKNNSFGKGRVMMGKNIHSSTY